MSIDRVNLAEAKISRGRIRNLTIGLLSSATVLTLAVALPTSASTRPADVAHSSGPPSAKTLISEMKSAIAKVTDVRLTITAKQTSPAESETLVVNSGTSTGDQTSVSGKEKAAVILTKSDAYLSGNSTGLSAFFGLPADDESLVGSKWIVIKSGTSQYKTFTTQITIKGLLGSITPSSSSFGVDYTNYGKTSAYGISWTTTNSGTTLHEMLYLPRSGKELPIAETATTGSVVDKSIFSRWNESFKVTAPKKTIAISKLHST